MRLLQAVCRASAKRINVAAFAPTQWTTSSGGAKAKLPDAMHHFVVVLDDDPITIERATRAPKATASAQPASPAWRHR
jgi:hypothetical protein